MSEDQDWELALVVRKVKVIEVSNNTISPTTGCLPNVPQETKLPTRNRKWSYKQRQRGGK